MCFYKVYRLGITHEFVGWRESKIGRHKIAGLDIPCYKVMYRIDEDKWISPHLGFVYEKGMTYTEDSLSLDTLDRYNCLEDGVFHSYCWLPIACMYATCGAWHTTKRASVVKCVIPAGTPYWESDRHDEYASTSIRVVEEYTDNNIYNVPRYY